jgi:hypothetical protein
VSKEYAVIWYSMTRDVQETRGHAAARSMRRESRAETRERVERELRKREERAATRERQWREARERERRSHRRHQEDIKKKRSPRKRSKGALSRQQRRDAEGPGLAREA